MANESMSQAYAHPGWKFFQRSFGLVALLVSLGLHAQDSQNYVYDRKVFAFLPEWCKYTAYYNSVVPHERGNADARREYERLNRLMGPQNFKHLHHYCRGLFVVARARYFEPSKTARDRLLRNSIAEFNYVLNRVEPTFALLPEILTKKGESYARLGRPEAVEPLHRALQAKPDYWPAYAALSDYFRDTGQVEQARQWLQKGLAAAPNATPLQRRLAEIDNNAAKRATR
jgi:tetratricopeptide (TPR) repeat protein